MLIPLTTDGDLLGPVKSACNLSISIFEMLHYFIIPSSYFKFQLFFNSCPLPIINYSNFDMMCLM